MPRAVATIGAIVFIVFGAWAMLDPRSFFEAVARFEPYNQHFLQDIGAFQIGLGVVLVLAVAMPRLDALAVTLLGTGVGAAAHSVSHIVGIDLGGTPVIDIPISVGLAVLLLAAGAVRARAS